MAGYSGEYRSAIARAKRILIAAGFPWSRTTGRYTPFGYRTQRTSDGVRVTRMGVSETVVLHSYLRDGRAPPSEHRELEAYAIAALRAGGMAFDDRGWLTCGNDAKGHAESVAS